MLSVCTHFDLGRHGEHIQPGNLSSLLKFSYVAGFFSILAAAWSKSSFALTLLCISNGWTKRLVWFVLVSVNIVLGLGALLQWIQCWPIYKLWLGGDGVCWVGFKRMRDYNTFSAGEFTPKCERLTRRGCCGILNADARVHHDSILGRRGCRASIVSVEYYLAGQDPSQREVRGTICHEHGSIVCVLNTIVALLINLGKKSY